MTSSPPEYVDHPAPSVVNILLLLGILIVLLAAIPDVASRGEPLLWIPYGLVVAVMLFYLWPFNTTYYTVSAAGLGVRYGPWKRFYNWSEFSAAYWRKGMITTRIGWPSITPCVRFTDAVHLKRPGKLFGLYLTPNDSRAFLAKIAEFAPDLTRSSIY